MKKIIMTMSLLCAALSTRAYQEVYGWGYCMPVSESWIQGEGFISPSVVNLNYDEPSATFKAAALDNNAGWKVAAWYYSRSYNLDVAKKMIPGSEERGELTWTDDKESNIVCLYVKYAYITYKVKYLGDGNGIPSGTFSVSYTNELRLAAAPSRSGYTFAGWQDGSKNPPRPGGASVYGASFPELASVHTNGHEVVLTAKWKANTYTIRFDGNGATGGSMSDLACTYDRSVSLTKNAFAKSRHDFVGWRTEKNGTGSYYSDQAQVQNLTATQGAVVTLYAQWRVRQHQVTVGVHSSSTGRGSVTPDGTSTYNEGASFQIVATPYQGYEFKEWADGSTDNPRTVTVTGPATYNAVFEHQGYTLKVYPCGGVYAGEMKPVEYRELYPLKPQTTNFNQIGICTSTNGAAFLGYYSGMNGSGTQVYDQNGKCVAGNAYWTADGKYNKTSDMSVYACWGPAPENFEVVFSAEPTEAGEIRVDYDGRQVTSNDFALTVIEGSNFVMTATATNGGYSFSCWTNSLGFTTNDNPWTYAAPSVVTNVALFTGNVYKVTFLLDDEEYDDDVDLPKAINVTYGSPFGELPNPTIKDPSLKFNGWMDEKGEDVVSTTVVRMMGTRNHLYAKIGDNASYRVAYEGGEKASGSMTTDKAYMDWPYQLKANIFAQKGYTFANWTNAVGNVFADGAMVTNLAAAGVTATLYAVWSNNVYTVDFDANGGTGTMPSQQFTYDVTNDLNKCEFGPPAGMKFVGWSNDVLKVVYTNGQPVANLCSGAAGDDRIILTAVWSLPDVGKYSRAMHCTTLEWNPQSEKDWSIVSEGGYDESGSEVKGTVMTSAAGATEWLEATVMTSGTLRFAYKIGRGGSSGRPELKLCYKKDNEWMPVCDPWPYENPGDFYADPVEVHLTDEMVAEGKIGFSVYGNNNNYACLDQVTWTPDSPVPTPDEPVAIESASVAGGSFRLGVLGEKGVDYGVWTNADLTVPAENWGFMTNQVGVGAPFEFELKILPNEPKLFYRAYKVK